MENSWKDLFTFSRREKTGITALLLILLALILLYPLIPSMIREEGKDLTRFYQQVGRFYDTMDSLDSIRALTRHPPWHEKEKEKKTTLTFLENYLGDPFIFDPNKADKETLVKTGLNEYAVTNMIRYRANGGTFKKPADLEKIYGMENAWLEAVSKHMVITTDGHATEKNPGYREHNKTDLNQNEDQQEEPTIRTPFPMNDSVPIELNSADSAALTRCRGIGPSFSRRIIKYRILLGGFYHKRQLLEVYGMDTARYLGFRDQVTANPDRISRMNIDTIAFKDLLRHPYFEYYLVKAIFNLREEKKGLDSIEELKSLPEVYPELYQKIAPYLTVGD